MAQVSGMAASGSEAVALAGKRWGSYLSPQLHNCCPDENRSAQKNQRFYGVSLIHPGEICYACPVEFHRTGRFRRPACHLPAMLRNARRVGYKQRAGRLHGLFQSFEGRGDYMS